MERIRDGELGSKAEGNVTFLRIPFGRSLTLITMVMVHIPKN